MIDNVSPHFPLLAKQSLVGNRYAIRVSHWINDDIKIQTGWLFSIKNAESF